VLRPRFLLLAMAFAVAQAGAANAPCDGAVPIKGCKAEVALDGNFVVLKSSTPNCSVIEWTIDGRGRQTTVLDGEERLELLTTRPKDLTIESCTQVKDLRAISRGENSSGATQQTNVQPDFGKYCGGPNTNLPTHWRCTQRESTITLIWCKSLASSEPTGQVPLNVGTFRSDAQRRRYFELMLRRPNWTPAEEREFSDIYREAQIAENGLEGLNRRVQQFVASRCG
jgi:hypothetical protein